MTKDKISGGWWSFGYFPLPHHIEKEIMKKKMKRRFVTLLLCIMALFFISCSDSDDYRLIVEEPTFGTLVFIDSEGNIHEWTEDGDFSGMTPIIIED